MPKPTSFGKFNNLNQTLTEAQKADGWHFPMTKDQEWDKYGYVVRDQIRFSLHVQDGLLDVVEDYLETEKKDLIDINLPGNDGKTPLMVAAKNGHAKVLAALLKAGADIGLVDQSIKDKKITAVEYAKGWPHQIGNERRDDCVEIIEEFMRTGQVPEMLSIPEAKK
ncbi:unnamed protein product [Effrenium voratum]|uniref:Ankyrin repeat domain-containing protein n=2 Tax=Effrenium voratum TaxID=2562239 RepID=A0AA36JPP5_9DINO|nr:unnamed protein product [Effrenium voratum]CAJ1410132.1 unnamed protein product [Effrenium voratum]CAJ1460289.1 unnamed protein product [Effrenium voratum]